MKTIWTTTMLSLAMSATCLCGKPKERSQLFLVSNATKFVFVKEKPFGNGLERVKNGKEFDVDKTLKATLNEASLREPIPSDYPLIGILGEVLLLDKVGNPICSLNVVNWCCIVNFYGVTLKNGHYYITDSDKALTTVSEPLGRWMYDQVKRNMPDEFERLQKLYKESVRSLEQLLFRHVKEDSPKKN